MTEKEIKEAKYIQSDILPKLQEIQRDLYFDENIQMDVECSSIFYGMSVYLRVISGRNFPTESLYTKYFEFTTYSYKDCKKKNNKTLRGIIHFIKNWKEQLA